MKFLYFAILALATLAQAADGRVQEKLLASYTESASQNPVVYTRSSRPVLEQKAQSEAQQYVAQPTAYATAPTAQQFYQAQPQAVAYAQPAVAKYVNAPVGQKIAFAQPHQLQRRPQQYSSAADVSSFSYTSPVVAYSNLGVLRPLRPQPQPQQQPIVQAAATSFVPSQAAVQYAAPSSYPSDSNGYDATQAYQAIAQKALYAEPQPQPQASTYQTSPVNQKIIFQAVPAYQVQAAQRVAPQVSFAPSQQFAYQTPQAAAPQNYEAQSQAQSAPQLFYSQPAAQQQQQYYSTASQPKYSESNVIYGH